MKYIQRRLHSFYEIVLNDTIVGIATAFYTYEKIEKPYSDTLSVNVLFHNGFERFDNVRLHNGNWRHFFEEEVANQDNLQAKDLINRVIAEIILNLKDYTVGLIPRREAFEIFVTESSDTRRRILFHLYSEHPNKKQLLVYPSTTYYDFGWEESDEDIIEKSYYFK